MFRDFFVRAPFDKLQKDPGFYLDLGLNPEIFINGESLSRFDPAETARGRALTRRFSAHTLHAPFLDVSPGASDTEIRRLSLEKMLRICRIAEEWESKLIVMHFNYDPIYYRNAFPEWLKRAAEFFRTLLDSCQNPMIALENIAEPTPYVALRLQQEIGRDRAVHCFDFGHHNVFGELAVAEWLFYLQPRRHLHFHVHDNHGDDDTHLPPGQGAIDWHEARELMAALPVDFTVTMEPHNRENLLQSVAFYRSFFLGQA